MDNLKGRGEQTERGKPAAFDPATGEVRGSGSGAGGGSPGEDYDSDPAAGSGAKKIKEEKAE